MRSARRTGRLAWIVASLVAACVVLTGCFSESIAFNAVIQPHAGHVPFEAVITATPNAAAYEFALPQGTVQTTSNTLRVEVDDIEWQVTVTCELGNQVVSDTVTAYGTNPPPRILPPLIDGQAYWTVLRPLERTIIQCRVDYDRSWLLVDAVFNCSETPEPDSIYAPPYEPGVFHVFDLENAFVVYPTRVSELAPNGLPYAHSGLDEGYPSTPGGWSHNLYFTEGFPEQTATISLTVEDEWGRQSSTAFTCRVATKYGDFDYR